MWGGVQQLRAGSRAFLAFHQTPFPSRSAVSEGLCAQWAGLAQDTSHDGANSCWSCFLRLSVFVCLLVRQSVWLLLNLHPKKRVKSIIIINDLMCSVTRKSQESVLVYCWGIGENFTLSITKQFFSFIDASYNKNAWLISPSIFSCFCRNPATSVSDLSAGWRR